MKPKGTKKSDQLAVIKNRGAAAAHQTLGLSQERKQTVEAGMRLGAAGALFTVARKLTAESFRMLEQFADTKGHEAMGFSRFDDFLDDSPYSPMSSNQYYDRKGLLEQEGDSTFDVLNELKIPVSARKQLPDGVVRIEGDTIFVADEAIQATDRERVKELIHQLARKNSQQSTKLQKGEKDFDKLSKEVDALKKSPAALGSTPHNQALMLAVAAIGGLALEAEKLSPEEATAQRDEAMRLLSAQWANLQYAYHFEERPASSASDSIFTGKELDEMAVEI
jgi:hypothetical protein